MDGMDGMDGMTLLKVRNMIAQGKHAEGVRRPG